MPSGDDLPGSADSSGEEQRRRRRQGDPRQPGFIPETMDKSVIAIPLLDLIDEEEEQRQALAAQGGPSPPYQVRRVIIDLNLEYQGGRDEARRNVEGFLEILKDDFPDTVPLPRQPQPAQYIFARMSGPGIATSGYDPQLCKRQAGLSGSAERARMVPCHPWSGTARGP